MERLTKNEGGVITYIGPGCRYDTGEIPAEVGTAGVRLLIRNVNAYESTGLTPEEITTNMEMFAAYRHVCGGFPPEQIEALIQAQQAGRLVVLPCKVGDTVWVIERCGNVRMSIDDDYETGTGAVECPFENSCDIEDCGDDHVRIFETPLEYVWYGEQNDCHPEVFLAHIGHGYMRDDFGKTVFLTLDEAETALKEATPCTE